MKNVTIDQRITQTDDDMLQYFFGFPYLEALISAVNEFAREYNLKIIQITEPKYERTTVDKTRTWNTIVLFEEKETK